MAETGTSKLSPPPVIWAQREDKIYLTINLEDCVDPVIKLTDKKLYFKGKGGTNNKEHELDIEFYGELNPKKCKYLLKLSRHIPMVLMRKEKGPYWPRLLSTTQKMHWLKTDFDKWKDEDDAPDPDEYWDMEEMMTKFDPSDYKPEPAGGKEEEEDSDDEDMPDLE